MESFYQSHWILTFLILFPVLGALAAYLAGERNARTLALGAGVVEFLVSVPLFFSFDPEAKCTFAGSAGMADPGLRGDASALMQNCANAAWFPDWGIRYQIGMDGISLFMVLLTTLLLPLMVLGSWTYIRERQRTFYPALLTLTSGVVGVFVALDMFLFYMFWEMMLIPMYFLIGVWGGK